MLLIHKKQKPGTLQFLECTVTATEFKKLPAANRILEA